LSQYTIGLDFGTNSVRALVVDVANGEEVATSVWDYRHGQAGVVLDASDPHLARQHPDDYQQGAQFSVAAALETAAKEVGLIPSDVIGLGIDTTGSTPLPLDESGQALALRDDFRDAPAAMAWLWKDHTGHAEAAQITEVAHRLRPQYIAKCGGTYSSEWFWSKVLRCLRAAPEVFDAAYTWAEIADWIPAFLTGNTRPDLMKRGICAAGHKALFHPAWGYPDEEFLSALDPKLARVGRSLPERAATVAESAGGLADEWATKLGLPAGIPVAVGAFDAHLGGIGSGIRPGTLVKIIGTSTCDMMVAPLAQNLPDVPGLCGIVPESILPGFHGLEAGQSAVGDIFNWFAGSIRPGGDVAGSHEALTEGAENLKVGESGLLGLDWHNGNRTVLVDQRLTGLLVGLNLHTTPAEIYRALIESTAFGARVIIDRFEEYGVMVERVVNCGGISAKNRLVMQIYADVFGRPLAISRSAQTCALGAAIAGAVVAGEDRGGHASFEKAVAVMTGVLDERFEPIPENVRVYDRLYAQYRKLHDSFGKAGHSDDLSSVMKKLLALRDEVKGS
jgi:L-ribulokinase